MSRKKPSSAPKPAATSAETISAADFCSLSGLTDRRHRQLAAAGYFPPPIRGQYDRDKCVAGLIQFLREQLQKKDDLAARERGLLTKAKREREQEELALFRQKYIAKEVIGPALRNLALHQRATLQLKLENELAPNLVGLKTEEVLERVRAAVDAICKIFNEGTRQWMNPRA